MKVYTRIVLDSSTWNIVEADHYEYDGPVALCDRALAQQAVQGGKQAEQTAGQYGAAAGGIQGFLLPQLERQTTTPAGFGPFGLAEMETGAESTAAGASGAAQERAKLNAMRTGNAAGLASTQAAAAEGAARAGGSALQDILAKNAQLKAEQQLSAQRQLGQLYGEDVGAQTRALGILPEDVSAGANAEKVGWLQNVTSALSALGSLGQGIGAARGGG